MTAGEVVMVQHMFADLVRYVGFTDADSRRLVALRAFALPELPAIADAFYANILVSESARAVLRDPQRATALRTTLVRWMDDILAGPHDEHLAEIARRIGHTHVRVAAPPRYVVGGLACIRTGLLRVAATSMSEELLDVASAVGRLLDIEGAVMMEAYSEHWLALVQRKEREELHRVQSRLEDVEWALEQSSETANMLVIGLDGSGRVVLFNAAAAHITGIPIEHALGKDAFELLFGEAAHAIREIVLASPSLPPFLELSVRTRDENMHTCRFYLSRHTPWQGNRPTHLLTAIDWEDERRAQRAEWHRARMAAIGNLGSGFAHEIRNPLNGAMLTSKVLQRAIEKNDPNELREANRGIDVELHRIKKLTDEFLTFVNPVPLKLASACIGTICTRVADHARVWATTGASVQTELSHEPLVVEADECRLEIALEHLVHNALEALVDGKGTVVLRARRDPAHATIEVEDDGHGLAAPSEVVFDAFFTTKVKGTGLGLAIAQRTALDHGGSLEVDSAPGKTVFSLRLPLLSPLGLSDN